MLYKHKEEQEQEGGKGRGIVLGATRKSSSRQSLMEKCQTQANDDDVGVRYLVRSLIVEKIRTTTTTVVDTYILV